MTKRKNDWADKAAERIINPDLLFSDNSPEETCRSIRRVLRSAERRGFMRAVKMLRENPSTVSIAFADWLEENK